MTKNPKKKLNMFIPARALEHHGNSEFATLRDKIIWAILRFAQKKDFSANLEVIDPIPFVDLREVKFNKEDLGYEISAILTRG